jgi:alpha-amylase
MLRYTMNRFFKCLLLAAFLLSGSATISLAQSTNQTYWWNDAVFYEVFVRSFKDNDGDGKGDLKGLIDKLDYLNDGDPTTNTDLGITGIWLMPVQQAASYHGYDATDYRTVEVDYGTNADFQTLVTEAHNRGIKVIIDYVMNHTSSQHPWFQSSIDPLSDKRNWYIWENPSPSVTGPWGQQVWYPKNGSNYFGLFWSEMPDLNYTNPAVKAEMFDAAKFWLNDMNVDGFRLDAARYIVEDATSMEDTPETIEFWKEFRTSYKSVKANAFAVGEAWATTDIAKEYVSDTTLDYCFEFDLASALVTATNSSTTANITALGTQLNKVVADYPFLQYGTFLTNHDMNRVIDQLGNDVTKAKLASCLLLTLPGVTYIYYGEEIGMRGSGADQNKRTPLQWDNTSGAGFTTGTPWEPVNTDYTTKNIASQQLDNTSLWNNYRKLIALRNNQPALRRGAYQGVNVSSTQTFSFLRQYAAENIIVVANMGSIAVSNLQLSLTQAGIAPGNYTMVELQGGTSIPITVDNNGSFSGVTVSSIPGRTVLIYKLFDPSQITTTVTFQVNMNGLISAGKFNPATETVDIVADFNSYGTPVTTLSDTDGNGIYSITISGMDIGHKTTYKYRLNGVNDAQEEFAGSSYLREYIVLEGADTITDVYQLQTVTGIEDLLKHAVMVYPVPSNKEVFIEFSADFAGTINYQIVDLLGEEKAASSFVTAAQAGQYRLSCEGLPAGLYLLNLTYNETKQAFRIIIQK